MGSTCSGFAPYPIAFSGGKCHPIGGTGGAQAINSLTKDRLLLSPPEAESQPIGPQPDPIQPDPPQAMGALR